MTKAYYNENDPYPAQWLRNLIAAGHIAPGDVDERSIKDVTPDDLKGYTQCHFFAGIGGWSYALRLAGWSDDRAVWTGSCPCQPFSEAGQGRGFSDPRHLWPEFYRLIQLSSPTTIFGEQTPRATVWLDGVCADLETLGYAMAAAVLPACSADAPHLRERIFFVSHASGSETGATQSGNRDCETKKRQAYSSSSFRGFTCGDGRSYRVPESGIPFVADGFPGLVERISAYGNAIVPQVAAEFIQAATEAIGG